MRKLLFAALSALVLVGCGGTSVTGSWSLEAVEGEELTDMEKSTTFTLNDDGTFTMSRDGREGDSGTWEWSEDKTDIVLRSKERDREEIMEDVKVEGDLMKFMSGRGDRKDAITLKKK